MSGANSKHFGQGIAGSLVLIGVLVFLNIQQTLAGQFGLSANRTNAVTTAVLSSPTGLTASRSASSNVLSWTAPTPMNGNGYVITGVNNGASSSCPAAAAAYTTYVGSTAATTFTDSGALAAGTAGTYVCYLVRTGYRAAGAPPWAAAPTWTSGIPLATAAVQLTAVPVPTLVQSKKAGDGTGGLQSISATWNGPTTAGNLLVAAVGAQDGSVNVTMPAGWVAGPVARATDGTFVYYYPNAPGFPAGTTVTANLDGNTALALVISEWKNVAAASPFERSGTTTGAGLSASVSSTATTQNGELALTAVFNGNATNTETFIPGAGWIDVANTGTIGGATLDVIYQVQPVMGVATATDAWNVSGNFAGAIATFKHS